MVVSYLSATVLKYLKMLGRKTYNKILALYKTWKMPLCQAVLKDRTIIVVRLYLKLNRSPKACVALLLLLLCHNFPSYYKAILIRNSVNVLHSRVAQQM